LLTVLNHLKSIWRKRQPVPISEGASTRAASQGSIADIVAALPDGALVIDESGNITASNGLARDVLQLDPLGLPFSSVLRNAAFASAVAKARSTMEAVSVDIEIHGALPRQFSVHVAPIGAGGEFLITLRDLTREQRIEKMRSDFVANASHEMRTPLASIMASIETLQGAAKNDRKARETFLDAMLVQAQRMRRLIDDLLTLSRIEMNEHVRPAAKIDLALIARQACGNLAAQAKAAQVDIVCDAKDETVVLGDGDELLQVAQNLIENAIKYGGAGKRVDVNCRGDAGHAALSVRDYGPGIAEIHLPRLTERFYRVNTQESRARGGTGLGLAIVKHIVSRHRGQLDIQSEPGKGSTFCVTIPSYESSR
jgi:two-component system phosphate regulon sensor histidine kinase PhoR